MTQRTTDDQMPELRRDFDRFEYISNYLQQKENQQIDKNEQNLTYTDLSDKLNATTIRQFASLLNNENSGQFFIYDSVTCDALNNMDNTRFLAFLEKQQINHFGKDLVMILPVINLGSLTLFTVNPQSKTLRIENNSNFV